MKRTAFMLALTFAVGIVVGVIGNHALNAQQQPLKRTVLQKVDLGDKEGIMWLAELAPGAAGAKHYHPGHEFTYIVAGSVTAHAEGKSPVTLKSGDSNYRPPKEVHWGVNTSKTDPVKILVFLLAEKGQPIAIDVK